MNTFDFGQCIEKPEGFLSIVFYRDYDEKMESDFEWSVYPTVMI